MKRFAIKFFGSKNKHEQIEMVKTAIEAKDRSEVEERLRHYYGYAVINGLKIRECQEK